MSFPVDELPQGWALSRLGEVIPKPRPKIPADPRSALPFIGMDHIESNSFSLIGLSTFAEMKSAGSFFDAGDVLYGRLRPYLNKVHRAKFRGVASAEFIVFPETDGLNGDFLKYLLHQKPFVDFAMERASGDRPRVKFNALADFVFGLPPLTEQERIVEKIETLFAELDKGEEALRAVQKLLTRYRQSVLKAAVTGALTAEWRATNPPTETGQDFLTRILKQRRETWQGRGRYAEPKEPDLNCLVDLPDGWIWTSLGFLIASGPQNGLYLPQSQYQPGTPILRIDDYQVDWIRPKAELRQVVASTVDCAKYALAAADIVVNRVNSVSHLGKSALVEKGHAGTLFESNMMRFALSDLVSAEYIAAYLGSDLGRKLLIKNCKHAVNQASINQDDVEGTPVPLPPRAEQEVIIERIIDEKQRSKAALSLCELELRRSAALRQSILKDAFAGTLMPQDPADEPAADLLARIRASVGSTPKRTRRKAMA